MDELEIIAAAAAAKKKKMAAPPQGGVSTNSEAIDEFKRKAGALWIGGVNGASSNFVDELAGFSGGLSNMVRGGTYSDGYTSTRDVVRGASKKAQEEEPLMYNTGQIGGTLVPALASAPAATGKTLFGTTMRGLGIGGVEGFLWGLGEGEGGKDRWDKAVKNAILGAIVGGGVPLAVSAGKSAIRSITDPAGGALNIGNKVRANRAIASTVRKSGQSLDDIADDVTRAAQLGQPEYRTMDAMGITGQRRASGLARAGGEAGDDIAEYLSRRQLDQGDRVAGFVDDAFGMNGRTAKQTTEMLRKNRKTVADALFDQAKADAKPVDVRGAVASLDDTIAKMTNSGIEPPKVVGEYQKLRAKLAGMTPNGEPTTLSDYESVLGIWREVRDEVDKAYKAGDGALGEALKPIRDQLQAALEDSSDLYRSATDLYRVGSGVIDAVDTGAEMTARGSRAADNVDTFNSMTPQQQRAARIGYGDRALAGIEANPAPTANKARPFQSTKMQTEADAIALDPETFRQRMANETRMWETQHKALGGSQTANNLNAMAETDAMAQDMAGALAVGNSRGVLASAVQAVAPKLTGQNEAVRKLMAQALMSQDPRAALGPAMQSRASEMLRQRMLEALLRNAAREHTPKQVLPRSLR